MISSRMFYKVDFLKFLGYNVLKAMMEYRSGAVGRRPRG